MSDGVRGIAPADRCPVCGLGTLVDVAFDLDAEAEDAPSQTANSRQLITYSCGHKVPGPSLSSADPERLEVEQRDSEETVDPAPGEPTEPGDQA
jgi:hypothetical protein